MAASPIFATTPKAGSAAVSATADTGWTAPSNTVTIVTGGSSGSKVEEIIFQGIGVTLAGIVNVFLYDGTNYSLIDQVKFLGVSGSTTASAERFVRQYSNLLVPNGYSLRVTSMVASQLVRVTAFYADF